MVEHIKACNGLKELFTARAEALAEELVSIFSDESSHDRIRSVIGSTGFRKVEELASIQSQIDAHIEEWIAL